MLLWKNIYVPYINKKIDILETGSVIYFAEIVYMYAEKN